MGLGVSISVNLDPAPWRVSQTHGGVGEKDPSRQIERVQRAGTVEGAGQQSEVRKDADRKIGGPRYLLLCGKASPLLIGP